MQHYITMAVVGGSVGRGSSGRGSIGCRSSGRGSGGCGSIRCGSSDGGSIGCGSSGSIGSRSSGSVGSSGSSGGGSIGGRSSGSSGYTPRLRPVSADNGVGCSGRYGVDADIGGNALHEVRSCQWRLQVVNTALTHGVVTPGIELVVWGGNVGVRGV